jgi:hypothetical protein
MLTLNEICESIGGAGLRGVGRELMKPVVVRLAIGERVFSPLQDYK